MKIRHSSGILILVVLLSLSLFALPGQQIMSDSGDEDVTRKPKGHYDSFDISYQMSSPNPAGIHSWSMIAVNKNDRLMMAHYQDAGGTNDIYSRISDDNGVTWTAPLRTGFINEECKGIDIVADSNGDFHMIFSDGSSSLTREIYYAKYSSGAWSARQQLSVSHDNANWCRLSIDDDTMYCVWYQEVGWPNKPVIFMRTKVVGGSWSSQVKVFNDPANGYIYPDVASAKGNIFVTAQKQIYGGGDALIDKTVVTRERRGNSWLPQVEHGPRAWSGIEADQFGRGHHIWPASGRVWYAYKPGDNWAGVEQLDTIAGIDGFFHLDYANRYLAAMFIQGASRNPAHDSAWFRIKQYDGAWGNWGEAIEVEPGGEANLPKGVFDGKGWLHMVWDDWSSTATREPDTVWYNRFKVGGESSPQLDVDKTSLSFQTQQTVATTSQTFKVRNLTSDTIDFAVASNQSWATVTPTSGSVGEDWTTVTVSVDPEIAVGNHTATVTVSSTKTNNSPTLTVNFTVLPPPIFSPDNFQVVKNYNRGLFQQQTMHKLTWEHDSRNQDVATYKITATYTINNVITVKTYSVPGTSTELSINNVIDGVEYKYSISTIDSKGNESDITSATIT